jgi:hypothetical protein
VRGLQFRNLTDFPQKSSKENLNYGKTLVTLPGALAVGGATSWFQTEFDAGTFCNFFALSLLHDFANRVKSAGRKHKPAGETVIQ